MIYLITGVPGSGKTLYAVSTLVQQLMRQKLSDSAGRDVERRLCVDGIPDLAIDHVAMAPSVIDDKTNTIGTDGHGIANWPDWVQAGDVLVVDEVQRYFRPRALGTKPPDCIKQLETHRHKGIDLVLITQNPMLIDQNIRRLVNRHIHVRRLFGMNRAIIYDWDGCQADTHRVAGATKSYWGYPQSAFALYKSSELHTKQKQKIPAWLVIPALAVVGAITIAPQAYSALKGSMTGQGIASDPKSNPTASGKVTSSPTAQPVPPPPSLEQRPPEPAYLDERTAFIPRVSYLPQSAPGYDHLRVVINMPLVRGGMCFKGVCKCVTQQGTDAGLTSAECKSWIDRPPFDPYTAPIASAEKPSERRPSEPLKSAAAPSPTVGEIPMPSGVAINPTAEARQPSVFPPGSPVHTTPSMDVLRPMTPPTLQSPYRRS